ncbi:chromatin-remodeling ATPase INO80-like [Papaver somniferum]|uniref:chromatin-remodeling ATPase INO80-like n=1 Tax=Papaver somniferum TaxID=3469 RepID=UPI000E6FEECC|nr:chromatin-remodeling ATPase INO80-like [Papaver somniferum]
MGCINTKNLDKKIVHPSNVLQKKVKSENNVEVKEDTDEGWALEKEGGNIAELSDGKEIDQVNMIKEKGLEDLVRRYECDSTTSEFDMLMKFLDKNGDGKKKRGNDLTPINHTPTPRGDKHLGVNNRGIHKNEKKMKNKFEIKLRERPVAESGVELEGVKHNDQEEVGVETNREGNENKIVEEETNNDEDEEEFKGTDDYGWEEEEANGKEEADEENDEEKEDEANVMWL